MRYTLEQLKAMNCWELDELWRLAQFPFDLVQECRACLTMHANTRCVDHPEFSAHTRNAFSWWDRNFRVLHDAKTFGRHLEELYALRLFYDSLYPPSDEMPSPTDAIAESEARTEVCEKAVPVLGEAP